MGPCCLLSLSPLTAGTTAWAPSWCWGLKRLREKGLLSLEKRRFSGVLPMFLSTWREGVKKRGAGSPQSLVLSDKTRGNGHKLKKKFCLNAREHCLVWRWFSGTSRPQKNLRKVYPWIYSKPGWTQFWISCSRWLCLHGKFGLNNLQRPLPTSAILWCCDSTCGILLWLPYWLWGGEHSWGRAGRLQHVWQF